MKRRLVALVRAPRFQIVKRIALLARGVFFSGARYECPVCNWSLRAFTGKQGFVESNADGYCPRCNSKARHRSIWRYLHNRTDFFNESLRFLEVAPWSSLASRFVKLPNIEFVGMDLNPVFSYTTVAGDIAAAPFRDDSFDAALCVHVLEHVEQDRNAIKELFRVLKPGGWAVVSVPLLLNEKTREDPAVTSREERKRLFGEPGHLRYYGTDFIDRLKAAGFDVSFVAATSTTAETRTRYGLRHGENIFHCVKPAVKL